ncbi:dehydratase [Streptomyces chrestomyceticus JCM 4735]|uniref:Dehydratase n=1 Tax=Streptomyces chrestomyceticus JCM 4735 TaxID=1306181 RepID=A0A7U9L1S1_9ACTN|nr:dehydratase [Streptomyces chrestomyceticus JCM 4735]
MDDTTTSDANAGHTATDHSAADHTTTHRTPEPPPLEGITVVAVEQAVAAPFATRQLADLGARVIKVERPDGGDFARGYDTSVHGLASHFVWANRGKESLALDLKDPRGRALLEQLLADADVFVQNLAHGAAARLGLDAAALCARYPRLVAVDISGYGPDGPYAHKRAYDMLVQCEAGLVSLTGTPEEPAKAGIPAADIAAAMYAFSGVLAALLRRGTTGRGGPVEVALLDALAEWLGHPLYFGMYGGTPPRARGSRTPSSRRTTPIRRRTGGRCWCPCRTTGSGSGWRGRCWNGPSWPRIRRSRRMWRASATGTRRTRWWVRRWPGWASRRPYGGWRRRGSPVRG